MQKEMDWRELLSLTTLMDHLEVGVTVFDANGKFLYVNRHSLQASGRSRSDYEGRTVYDLYREGIFNQPVITEVIETKKPVARVQRSTTKNGGIKEYMVRAHPIFDGEGNMVLIVSDRIDMKALTKLYESLRYSYHQAPDEQKVQDMERPDGTKVQKTPHVICKSQAMEKVMSLALRASQRDSSVLLQGKSGTGKEVVAEYIHAHSLRRNHAMVRINCASMPESLLESELFGYERGAFTGALQSGKVGLIELADKGTLFLDEVNSMPLNLQSKLLRVLETKTVLRIGARAPRAIDFRLIAASNEKLKDCVDNHTFREDPYYRLNVIPICIPPLKDRREDIRPLANHFLRQFCTQYGLEKRLLPKIYRLMQNYDWPGNVRELRNFIEWVVVMSTTTTVKISDVPAGMLQNVVEQPQSGEPAPSQRDDKENEREKIIKALEKFQNRRQDTADYLGISRRTLQYKLKKYGLLSHNLSEADNISKS